MKTLILGDGELGSEIIKQSGWDYISRKKDGFDVTDTQTHFYFLFRNYDVILNCIGYTKSYEKDKKNSFEINYKWVITLADTCAYYGKKICQISTDFVYANSIHPASENDPPSPAKNWYSYYKSAADAYVEAKVKERLIIRCSFKPNPFPYPKALTGLKSNTDYTENIAKKIIYLVDNNAQGIYNIGADKYKTIFELAQETNPDVQPLCDDIDPTQPHDTSMDLSKYNKFEKEHSL